MWKFAGFLLTILLVQATWASEAELTPLITGGNGASAGQFPYFASIVEKLPLLKDQIKCGGSILNERWILTSGQCEVLSSLKPIIGRVRVKVGQQNRWIDGEYVQTREVSLVLVHKKLEKGIFKKIKEFDIALVKLASPLILNKRVQPIILPAPKSIPKGKAVVTGFGAKSVIVVPQFPKVLQYSNVSIIGQGNCKDAINTISIINKDKLADTQICTGPLDSKITACIADSGAPLVQNNQKNGTVQIGIVSWGPFPCGQAGAPIVYTRVSAFVDWIKERISENSF